MLWGAIVRCSSLVVTVLAKYRACSPVAAWRGATSCRRPLHRPKSRQLTERWPDTLRNKVIHRPLRDVCLIFWLSLGIARITFGFVKPAVHAFLVVVIASKNL
jgi:hypothetical protein